MLLVDTKVSLTHPVWTKLHDKAFPRPFYPFLLSIHVYIDKGSSHDVCIAFI